MRDIKLEDSGVPAIVNGDFVNIESTRQHQKLLLVSEKGEWRESPLVGVAIRTELLNENTGNDLIQKIKREFEQDGMTVLQIKGQGDKIQTEAIYE